MHLKVFIVIMAICLLEVYCQDKYTTKYDNIDLDSILSNERLLKNYVDCVMERGRCTAEGKELKERIPDALETGCSKCNDKQKAGIKKVLNHLVKNKPDVWAEVTAKYDPEGKYKSRYEKWASSEGVDL